MIQKAEELWNHLNRSRGQGERDVVRNRSRGQGERDVTFIGLET